MIYVFDSDALITLFKHYYLSRFPSLWDRFDDLVYAGHIISVREVSREISGRDDRLAGWAKSNHDFFQTPSIEETNHVSSIFSVSHFQALIRQQERLQGKPVADPFVIAKAWGLGENGCVVTQEKEKPHAAKIPNVCNHFSISCKNLEQFMEQEKWSF